MPTKFPLTANININDDFGLPPSDTNYSAILAASTDTSLAVPLSSDLGGTNTSVHNYLIAVIRHSVADIWFANNATAAVPGGASFAATASQLLAPGTTAYKVKSGDVLHFYTTSSNIVVSVSFYWL